MARRFFVGGNFKMHGSLNADSHSKYSLSDIVKALVPDSVSPTTEIVVAPPFVFLHPLKEIAQKANPGLAVSAQDAYTKKEGAFTGEVSPDQLKSLGIPWVILGHSERRSLFGDTSERVGEKVQASLGVGLKIILCVGETLEQREGGKTDAVVREQLEAVINKGVKSDKDWDSIVIAYEPVWAIGTGKTATPEIAQETHAAIRAYLKGALGQGIAEKTRIIYGGSVKAGKEAELKNTTDMAQSHDIDGFLVGGASLDPTQFIKIINAKGDAVPKAKH